MIYPVDFGYKVSVEIIRDEETDNAKIKVYSPMYMKKEWTLGLSFRSSSFSDSEILKDRDFQGVMKQFYGEKL